MEENKNISTTVDKTERVVGFLALEFLALICFGFGGENGLTFLRVIGVCLALFLYPYAKNQFVKEGGVRKDLIALIPAGLTFLSFGFSRFWLSFYSASWFTGIIMCLLVSAGLAAACLLGYSVKGMKGLKRDYVFLAIGCGLALLVLISGLYSLVRYGVFYVKRFSKMVYYFDGVVFPVSKEAKILDGFLFREASLDFAKAPAVMLSCFGVGCLGCNPKKDKRFYAMLSFGILGFLDLILTPFKAGILLALFVYAYAGIMFGLRYLSNKGEKAEHRVKTGLRIAFFVLMAFVALGLIILVTDTFLGESASFLRKSSFIARKGADNQYTYTRLGRLIQTIEEIISATFFTTKAGVRSFSFVGFFFGSKATYIYNSSFAEFNFIYQNGMVGFSLLLIALFYGIYKAHCYFYESEDEGHLKFIVTGLMLAMFLYWSFLCDEAPLRHPQNMDEFFSNHQSLLLSFTRSNWALLGAFFFGYVYSPKKVAAKPVETKKEEEIHE